MTTQKISLYFFGTDEFATTILKRLVEDSIYEVRGVVTPFDQPVGRKKVLTPCPVKQFAETVNLPVYHDLSEVISLPSPDFIVVASYGRYLPQAVLNWPRIEPLNIHPSMLPHYRGASPIQTALLNGDKLTGICLIKMVKRMDAGPVYAFSEVAIRPDHDARNLRAEMAEFGGELVAQSMPGIMDGSIEALEQNEDRATECAKIDRSSGEVKWTESSAFEIECMLKAYTPWPGIYTFWNETRLKLVAGYADSDAEVPGGTVVRMEDGRFGVGARSGLFVLEMVQLAGKKEMKIEDFVRGYPDFIGSSLG